MNFEKVKDFIHISNHSDAGLKLHDKGNGRYSVVAEHSGQVSRVIFLFFKSGAAYYGKPVKAGEANLDSPEMFTDEEGLARLIVKYGSRPAPVKAKPRVVSGAR